MTLKKTCLLIEDDPEDQEFFMNALYEVSCTTGCYAVEGGEAALFTLLLNEILPDYIFTDLNMPGMNGYDFLKQVKSLREFKNIPVIVYSSYYAQEQFQLIKELGAVAIYPKTRYSILCDILKKYFNDN